jgi:hypothetical protein
LNLVSKHEIRAFLGDRIKEIPTKHKSTTKRYLIWSIVVTEKNIIHLFFLEVVQNVIQFRGSKLTFEYKIFMIYGRSFDVRK